MERCQKCEEIPDIFGFWASSVEGLSRKHVDFHRGRVKPKTSGIFSNIFGTSPPSLNFYSFCMSTT